MGLLGTQRHPGEAQDEEDGKPAIHALSPGGRRWAETPRLRNTSIGFVADHANVIQKPFWLNAHPEKHGYNGHAAGRIEADRQRYVHPIGHFFDDDACRWWGTPCVLRNAPRRECWPDAGVARAGHASGPAIAGCGDRRPRGSLSLGAEQELTYIALAYGDAHGASAAVPTDADELKPYLKTFGDPDDLLVSPNDGKPYVVVWKANPAVVRLNTWGCFRFSPTSRKGRRQRAVTDVRGRPMTIPEKDLEKLTFVRGHKPGKS